MSIREGIVRLLEWQERRCIFWWTPRDGTPNVGDELAHALVAAILQLADRRIVDKLDTRHRLFSIGSVLHYARSGETVWGSGMNGKVHRREHRFTGLDVRAVRGPLTRAFLLSRGIACPPVYGDPALLAPRFFPAAELAEGPASLDFVVVPHLNDPPDLYRHYGERVISPRQHPAAFIRRLLRARRVVSASLHGLVLAEAYGLPAVHLTMGGSEPRFKYEDYYRGTGRRTHAQAASVDAALAIEAPPPPDDLDAIAQRLLHTFPFELWGGDGESAAAAVPTPALRSTPS